MKKKKHYFGRGAMFVLCAIFAVLFLLPTVLTISNSFMAETEIVSNYGMIFSNTNGGFVSKTVNLKFIPDKVTLEQYISKRNANDLRSGRTGPGRPHTGR